MDDLEQVTSAPSVADYTTLSEHQATTPSRFFGAKPVLHLHIPASKLLISKSELESRPLFAALYASPATNGNASNHAANGTQDEQITIDGIDIWVTSEKLVLFAPAQSIGVSIPYPRLSLHALLTLPSSSTQGLYMQLMLTENPGNTADEDLETLESTLVPSELPLSYTPPAAEGAEGIETQADVDGEAKQTSAQALYEAVTACADLHPDPDEDDEDLNSGLTAPGAGGWITSENMHEFMDEDGNFAVQADGDGAIFGAGVVREREEDSDEEKDETKWQRTG